jgi:hypothetical protein
MPNRTSFDERDKYDHSSHSTTHRQPQDLKSPGTVPPENGPRHSARIGGAKSRKGTSRSAR